MPKVEKITSPDMTAPPTNPKRASAVSAATRVEPATASMGSTYR